MSTTAINERSLPTTALLAGLLALLIGHSAFGATVEEALRYVPVQKDVDYDRPSAKEIPQCKIATEDLGGTSSLVVRGPGGELLRAFTDTNGDNRVDQWRYFSKGIESYRDMDTNYNGKSDQHRWLGLAGMRWGIDSDEDGQIDRWQAISAEEVSAEIVGAVRDKDASRFAAVLLSRDELRGLGLDEKDEKRMASRLGTAIRRFQQAAAKQNVVDARQEWVHFSATRPGVLPAGTNGNSKDIHVYENVAAMLEKGQLTIGSLVRVNSQWRCIDIPVALMGDDAQKLAATFLLNPNIAADNSLDQDDLLNENARKLVTEVDKIDKNLAAASPKEKKGLYDRQAKLLRELASKTNTPKDQAVWIRQLAEVLGTAVESGDYPGGVSKLEKLHEELEGQSDESDSAAKDLIGYVKFRLLRSKYATRIQDPDAKNFGKIQDWWLEQLERFIEEYPDVTDTTEAMLQLAMAEEFAGNERAALKWYDRIISEGQPGLEVEKSRGARRRLTSVGKPLDFGGQLVDGKSIRTSQAPLRGRYVLIHFWATWCGDACLDDLKIIRELYGKYGRNFVPVGVNLDTNQAKVAAFLQRNKLNWPQIFEKGGLDSRPAVELGVLAVPTMLLLNEEGEVVNRNIHITELEEYLGKNLE